MFFSFMSATIGAPTYRDPDCKASDVDPWLVFENWLVLEEKLQYVVLSMG